MADRAKLGVADHAMIHALQVLSRPFLCNNGHMSMAVDILKDTLPRVSRDDARLRPIIEIAEKFTSQRPGPLGDFGGLHDRAAQVMRDWDTRRLADAWAAMRGEA